MHSRKFDFSSFFKAILTISIPVALQNLLGTTAGMVDTIMIGSTGQVAVAAVGICSQINALFAACYWGFSSGALLFFSQFWGAKNPKGINKAFGISFLFLMLVSFSFTSVATIAPEFLLRVYTDKENIIAVAAPYLRIVGFTYPLQTIALLLSSLMRSTERVKVPLLCSILAMTVNFCLNYVLIYGHFGFPKLGPTGAAIGTLISSIVNVTALYLFLIFGKSNFRIKLSEMFDFEGSFVKTYLTKCLPMIGNELLYGVGQMIINIVVGRQPEAAIAAMAAFRVLEGLIFSFFAGLSDAASVVVGKDIGAGRHMSGYRNTIAFSILCPAVTFSICFILFLVNQPTLRLFGLESEALFYGKYMLLIYLVAGSLRTCNYIMNNCFRVGGESLYGAIMDPVCLFCLSVPATLITGMVFNLPFLVIFAFVYIDEPVKFFFMSRYCRSGKWVKPVTKEGQSTLPAFQTELKQLHTHTQS